MFSTPIQMANINAVCLFHIKMVPHYERWFQYEYAAGFNHFLFQQMTHMILFRIFMRYHTNIFCLHSTWRNNLSRKQTRNQASSLACVWYTFHKCIIVWPCIVHQVLSNVLSDPIMWWAKKHLCLEKCIYNKWFLSQRSNSLSYLNGVQYHINSTCY